MQPAYGTAAELVAWLTAEIPVEVTVVTAFRSVTGTIRGPGHLGRDHIVLSVTEDPAAPEELWLPFSMISSVVKTQSGLSFELREPEPLPDAPPAEEAAPPPAPQAEGGEPPESIGDDAHEEPRVDAAPPDCFAQIC
jgi:hypothetical protein